MEIEAIEIPCFLDIYQGNTKAFSKRSYTLRRKGSI